MRKEEPRYKLPTMKQTTSARPFILLFALFLVLVELSAAQIVSSGEEPTCTVAGDVTLTVSDESGAVVPNAFALFRRDKLGSGNSKPVLVELRTDAAGKVNASVPCGYVDFFVAADGFTPQAKKLLIRQPSSSMSVRLNVYPQEQY